MSAAAAAAGAMARRQRQVVAAFAAAGATDAAHARSTEELALVGGRLRALQRLRGHDIIRTAAPNRFWVDLATWEIFRRRRRRVALTMALFALPMALLAATLLR